MEPSDLPRHTPLIVMPTQRMRPPTMSASTRAASSQLHAEDAAEQGDHDEVGDTNRETQLQYIEACELHLADDVVRLEHARLLKRAAERDPGRGTDQNSRENGHGCFPHISRGAAVWQTGCRWRTRGGIAGRFVLANLERTSLHGAPHKRYLRASSLPDPVTNESRAAVRVQCLCAHPLDGDPGSDPKCLPLRIPVG